MNAQHPPTGGAAEGRGGGGVRPDSTRAPRVGQVDRSDLLPRIRQSARAYYDAGLPPVPLRQGKPLTAWRSFIERYPSWDEVERLPWGQADGVALVLGHEALAGATWWVLDIEAPFRAEAEAWLDAHRPGWREGLVAESQSGGLHLYLLTLDPRPSRRCAWGDIKGRGGVVFAPPTRRFKPDAAGDYQWLVAPDVERFGEEAAVWACFLDPAAVPGGAARADGPPTETAGANGHQPLDVARALAGVPHGERNAALFRLACKLRQLNFSQDEAELVVARAAEKCSPPWGSLPEDRESIAALVARVFRRYPAGATIELPPAEPGAGAGSVRDRGGDAGRAPAGDGDRPGRRWDPVPLSALGDGEGADVAWVWDGFLGRGLVTELYGFWKAGKTTLIAALLARMTPPDPNSILAPLRFTLARIEFSASGGSGAQAAPRRDGEPGPAPVVELAGRRVAPGRALVVSEEPGVAWAHRRDELGLGDHVHTLTRPFVKRATWEEWEQFLAHITGLVRQHGYALVVFDSLAALWPVVDENDAGQVLRALAPLHGVAEAGCAVLLVHHPRKTDGGEATAGRGSGALAAFVDVIVEFRRADPSRPEDRRRVLSVYSRFAEPGEMVVEWRGGADYVTLGSRAEADRAARWETLHALLADLAESAPSDAGSTVGPTGPVGATVDELLARWGTTAGADAVRPGRRTLATDLEAAVRAGRLTRTGTGRKGDPYRYRLAAPAVAVVGDGHVAGTSASPGGATGGTSAPPGGGPGENAILASLNPKGARNESAPPPAANETGGRAAGPPAPLTPEPVAEPMAGPVDGPVDREQLLALAQQADYPRCFNRAIGAWVSGPHDWHLFAQAASDTAVAEAWNWLLAHHPPPRAGSGDGEVAP